jgi:hypothetical protein
MITGTAICYALFGRNFFLNILSPRQYSLKRAIHIFGELEWVSVGLLACLYNAWVRRRDAGVQLCSRLIAIALCAYFLERGGAGVYFNAQFDLVIAVAIGLGLAFTQISLWPIVRHLRWERAQAILVLSLCVRLLALRCLLRGHRV